MVNEQWFFPPRTFGGLTPQDSRYDSARVLIFPIPYDSTTSYKTGTRDGPMAIIDASNEMELYDHELDREISTVGIHTLPELQPAMNSPQEMVERVHQVASELIQEEKLLVMLGGEHLMSVGMVMAYKKKYPNLSVLQLDAHTDLRDQYLGTKYNHACTARRILESCPVVQAGVRSLSLEESDFLKENGADSKGTHRVITFFIEDFPLTPAKLDRLVSSLSPNVYISIDLDVLDPSIMPAVGNPEPGGLTWEETLRILRETSRRRRIVGFDVTELCPQEGPTACPFLAAKLTYKLIGYATHPWGGE